MTRNRIEVEYAITWYISIPTVLKVNPFGSVRLDWRSQTLEMSLLNHWQRELKLERDAHRHGNGCEPNRHVPCLVQFNWNILLDVERANDLPWS